MSKPHPCYSAHDTKNRWQGDLYATGDFAAGALPAPVENIPYWMLANRTCQLVETDGRTPKLSHLVFCAVVPLKSYLVGTLKNPRNAVSNVVAGKDEHACFLPESREHGIAKPFVSHFNLVWSVPIGRAPTAAQKIAQLSSPFAEHVFQRFSRWFYTVGYDDAAVRDSKYIDQLVAQISAKPE